MIKMKTGEEQRFIRIVDQVVQPTMSNLLLDFRKAGPNAFLVVNDEIQRRHPKCLQVPDALAIASSRKDPQTMAMEFSGQRIADTTW